MFRRLRPAGDPIRLGKSKIEIFDPILPAHHTRFFASGTESLAACLLAAKSHLNVSQPEVLMPAYCCPDLISAADFAGVKPVLIDFIRERPWMDLDQIRKNINKNTIAVVAVNFLGIPERLSEIRTLLLNTSILLISDSAQAFPLSSDNSEFDLCILSFARGKPVNLLVGGLVISRHAELLCKLPFSTPVKLTLVKKLMSLCKASLYNITIKPHVYWLTKYVPFLQLGTTKYHKLDFIRNHSSELHILLKRNIPDHIKSTPRIQMLTHRLTEICLDAGLLPLNFLCNLAEHNRLLRFPVLANTSEQRNAIYYALNKHGHGVSLMYENALPKVSGLNDRFHEINHFPRATSFANRLFTLPLHTGVTEKDLQTISRRLRQQTNTN